MTWTGTLPYDYFIIQDLSKGFDVSSNYQGYTLTPFINQNPSIKILNIIVKQVTSGIIGPPSNIYTLIWYCPNQIYVL